MRDARRFSAREVSLGVQRHVLDQTTWLGSTVMAHSGAVPPVFERSASAGGTGHSMSAPPVPAGPGQRVHRGDFTHIAEIRVIDR